MLIKQSVTSIKDSSRILKVKVINLNLKKKIKFQDPFIGIIKKSKSNQMRPGQIKSFMLASTVKKVCFFNGRSKRSDINASILLKQKGSTEFLSSRFMGTFFSEISKIKSQKTKIIINKCI